MEWAYPYAVGGGESLTVLRRPRLMTLLFAFLIGFFAGLRSLTPPAATAWAVYLGWLKLQRPLALIGTLPAVIVLTLLALAELVADKLPQTPSRTAPVGLIARLVTGGLAGACVSAGGGGRGPPGALPCGGGGLVGGFFSDSARHPPGGSNGCTVNFPFA